MTNLALLAPAIAALFGAVGMVIFSHRVRRKADEARTANMAAASFKEPPLPFDGGGQEPATATRSEQSSERLIAKIFGA